MSADAARSLSPRIAGVLLLAAWLGSASAARPMATDDTSTANAGTCQVEAWGERVDAERSQVIAPACGLTDELELDTAAARTQGSGISVDTLALGLKWVPEGLAFATPLGKVRLGLLGGAFWARDPAGGWRTQNVTLAGLSSLQFAPDWTVYLNLVTSRFQDSGQQVNGLRSALAWQPDERVLLFVEGLRTSDGGNLRNAGLRLWAVPELFGLDFVSSRSASGGLSFSVGFGWYGIAWH